MSEHAPTGDWPARPAALPGDWPAVPGYEILAELGRGGMGVVYKARQISSGRLVALKMIRDAALAGPRQRARFCIEAEVAARMRHPNVVEIVEVGEHAGRAFLAMEFVEGGSLDRLLAGRTLPAARAAALLRTLALAVEHAHGQRIVHRDLKPANVLLQMGSGESGMGNEGQDAMSSFPIPDSPLPILESFAVPKIADFGLAKRLDTDSTGWTLEGDVLGTPDYMAPEQAAGRVNDVGPAADVYALGAILYEALTGRPPFRAASRSETVRRVLHDEPEPPTRAWPDVPRDLETVCLKCLEKDPARRYASAGELARELGRVLAGEPVTAVPPGPRERLDRLAARDGYRLLAEVGRGPRSTVYRARRDGQRQPVAVKVFTPGVCPREEWEARYRRDAELRASLAHPQVVPVNDAGWWDDAPYLVAEYVPQGALSAKLAGRPWPVRQALGLVEQLAGVVAYLHRQGVVHGNLKPANVLLAANGIPRLADLRLTGGLFQGPPPAAGGGDATAGLAYLAPELVAEPGAEPRPYTDIYGLGTVLYELLTGLAPVDGGTTREVLERVRTRVPDPPSRTNPEVTPEMEWVCLRCLQKNPWKRYTRAYDLAARLRHLLDG